MIDKFFMEIIINRKDRIRQRISAKLDIEMPDDETLIADQLTEHEMLDALEIIAERNRLTLLEKIYMFCCLQ